MPSVKEKIDKIVPQIIEQLGKKINPLLLSFKNEEKQLLIFYFHSIYASEAEKRLHHSDPQNNITVNQLDEFIDYFLNHKYKFISEDDLLTGLDEGSPSIMMTFDDGYFNNSLALEILNKYKVPAHFFITTSNVLENKSYWWDIVYRCRIKEGKNIDIIRQEQEHLKKNKLTYIDEYIVKNFGNRANVPISDIDRPFSSSELTAFSDNPFVTIGNHTANHTILTNYNEQEIETELVSANNALKDITGKVPHSLAFPNGNYDEKVLSVAKQVGFRFALNVRPSGNRLPVKQSFSEMILLNRYMAQIQPVKEYGTFSRTGYQPQVLYEKIKKKAMFFKNI
jgi:peptidoglycan/xylan/chitin deacetylase (PgdA/CDA1 family)